MVQENDREKRPSQNSANFLQDPRYCFHKTPDFFKSSRISASRSANFSLILAGFGKNSISTGLIPAECLAKIALIRRFILFLSVTFLKVFLGTIKPKRVMFWFLGTCQRKMKLAETSLRLFLKFAKSSSVLRKTSFFGIKLTISFGLLHVGGPGQFCRCGFSCAF